MARRRRLSPATALTEEPISSGAPETKHARPPIASVVADTAGRGELLQAAEDHRRAREEGRLIASLPLAAIKADYLVRDRMISNDVDMAAIKASILSRGQQTPIEVEDLGKGRYGLVSGWRRLQALIALHDETGEDRFSRIKALIRDSSHPSDAYVAMVEENEIRANLSFYERARIADMAAGRQVFPTAEIAVRELFRHASRAKRSKILSFLRLHRVLGGLLQHPTAITERLGLEIVKVLETSPEADARFKSRLQATQFETADEELALLKETLEDISRDRKSSPAQPGNSSSKQQGSASLRTLRAPKGFKLRAGDGKIELSGAAVDASLIDEFQAWLESRFSG